MIGNISNYFFEPFDLWKVPLNYENSMKWNRYSRNQWSDLRLLIEDESKVLVSLPKPLRTEDFVLGMDSHIVKIAYRVLLFTNKN